MIRKHGLGRGLDVLIPDENIENKDDIRKININMIRANENQPRKEFDIEKLKDLANSIKEHGIIQPVILTQDGEYYKIVAGERRWRAAKLCGLEEIPSIVLDLSEKDILELSLIENLQREDLNPIESAKGYQRLVDEFKLTQDDLSKKVGKSRTAVTNSLRLLNLSDKIQEYLVKKVLSEGHGRALLGIKDKAMQDKVAEIVVKEKLSVRETEKLVSKIAIGKKTAKKEKQENIYYVDIKNKLENYFGTKVMLSDNNNKGKIEIEYYSKEDLQRILDILNI